MRSSPTAGVTDVYADASALVKLLVEEDESSALRAHVVALPRLSASAVALVEVARAARVRLASAESLAALWSRVELVPVDDGVLLVAAQLTHARLRPLDAIHIASAISVGAGEMLVYDRDLAGAAEAAGIRALSPGR
jgi:predicted nucleic acid-binding protein